MKSIKGTRTEQYLLTNFAGESQARNRYTYFASEAKKEGYEQISWIFTDTAENEKEHAKRFFRFLEGGDTTITATYPAGIISNTMENLKAAIAGENLETNVLYPEAARVADEEGFEEVARVYRAIAQVEAQHERRFNALLGNIESGTVFKKLASVKWRCRNCGYVHEGPEAPSECPACAHPVAYYELLAENY
ncbi:MAG TPA: rubrerythrin family protein [Syntrophorhabdaceae bacterium]|nr:rubrerythrin family protein [Syntrophorhabdaceae bacterium]